MFTKEHILAEIERTTQENEGKPLGRRRFEAETGIKSSDWEGKIWARWSDALVEAGLTPNQLQSRRDDDDLLKSLASVCRELGHFPVANEIRLRARTASGFPSHNSFARFGDKRALVTRLRGFAVANDDDDIVAICDAAIARLPTDRPSGDEHATAEAETDFGYVYLLKSGRYYKVGRSNAVGRRERELAIQLPEKTKVVHSIKTDDPVGIESYWHGRFADRRKNGEWFELTAHDVAAFKRRKFM